ncbi:MAG: hypothetical protein J5933_01665 [Clostridia bacterium]|nr:hypothetical protein [Clostridia bacterium]
MHPRVLIVGTVPYNVQSTSRAFDAYFHYWEKENIAQIFSNAKTPCKGHCGTLYQITDHQLVERWTGRTKETGRIFNYDELPDRWENGELEVGSRSIKKAYSIGSRHTPATHLLRGLLWRKKYWCTEKLNRWLDEFRPECVFLAFSNDFFIPRIAYYVACRYNVPIVSCIGDDYYFNGRFSIDPLYYIYKSRYKRLIRKVLSCNGSAIYISDKIRDKYNSEFGLDGETVYLSSAVERRPFSPVNREEPLITYFGNIRMGRNRSLSDIADALGRISDRYRLCVYSGENDPSYYRIIENNPHAVWGGRIPYDEVKKKMFDSDVTVIVEGFSRSDVDKSRYSLSTKAADALASGAAILTYGSQECGIVEYMQSTGASMVCTDKNSLEESIVRLIEDQELQKRYYDNQITVSAEHHNLNKSCSVSESVINKAINKAKKQ